MVKNQYITESLIKIDEIQKSIAKSEDLINYIGYSDGILGFSLFYYYEYLYSAKEKSLQTAVYYLEQSMSKLDENYKSPNPQIEIIEIGLYLMFLYKKGILSDDILDYLDDLDDVIEANLLKKIDEGDLGYTAGLLKVGYYFVKRENNNRNHLLHKILDRIENLSLFEGDLRYWKFYFRNPKNPYVELGLGHGVAGVVSFLLHLFKAGIETERCELLLNSSIAFLLSQNNKSGVNWFPVNAFENDSYQYHNLSYGDIGIGYTLYKAGQILKNKNYCKEALLILENAAYFRDEDREYIRDANLVYGASGLYIVFNLLYDLTQSDKILCARDYWYNKILEFGNETDSTDSAGYNTYFNGIYDYAQLGFSQGIAGIGMALMAQEIKIDNDYLSFLNYDL
ncbi:hypothetical protein J2Y38_004092 [Flavobacterium sp. 2755]|uniref:lanthionine synthetase LanC family protein n=1 Tax=Flavobacterium sp. 2755 TaxID=2817765 RepID=UPI00285D3E4C|nr:lanthionine synthetase LanC family protein [Flavobacterium sp. 2755]MDR6763868.1 hypothetical protein [Flavobacterium sp. 2755]